MDNLENGNVLESPDTENATNALNVNEAEESKNKSKRKRAKPPRLFPMYSLEDSIKILDVIKEYNAGNPWPPSEVAQALGMAPKSNDFYYLTASARDYGLTTGTRDTSVIEIASLGRDIAYATSPEKEVESVKKAFLNIDLFKSVYEYYKGGSLPDIKYTRNTLEAEFNIPSEQHDDFVRLYTKNLTFLNNKKSILSESVNIPLNTLDFSSAESISLGGPSINSNLVAFVIMPFVEKTDRYPSGFFDEVLRNLITPAAIEAGFIVKTAKREGSDIIHSTIINDLIEADLVIADLTEHNPNVLFELGIRIASRKPTCLIRAKGTKQIFDVDNLLRVYDYNPNLWKSTIEIDMPKITSHIRRTWEDKDSNKSYMDILLKTL